MPLMTLNLKTHIFYNTKRNEQCENVTAAARFVIVLRNAAMNIKGARVKCELIIAAAKVRDSMVSYRIIESVAELN
jgi:hypothetical protein